MDLWNEIYDDETNWTVKNKMTEKIISTLSKEKFPFYPITAVNRHGAKVLDVSFFKKLNEEYIKKRELKYGKHGKKMKPLPKGAVI
jgi:hypothetical protein